MGLTALAQSPRLTAQISVGRLKALFVERFTRFIEWPPGVLPEGSPFVVCIQGVGEMADNLVEVAGTRPFKGRRCEVRRVRAGSRLDSCHLIYLAPSEAPRLPAALSAVADRPILTVGDTPGFAQSGVLINLYPEAGLMRFEVNMPAVRRSNLTISSHLLRLARIVGESAPRPRPVKETPPSAPPDDRARVP